MKYWLGCSGHLGLQSLVFNVVNVYLDVFLFSVLCSFFFHLYFVVEGRLPKTGNSHSVEIGNERAQGFGTSLELEENS